LLALRAGNTAMRVTEKTKQQTRKRILAAAKQLFARQGFDETATRHITDAAGVATGTLFNYFANKEAIVLTLAEEAVQNGVDDFWKRRHETELLEEDIFALIAAQLRRLRPLRSFMQAMLDALLHPAADANGTTGALRAAHFEALHAVLRQHGMDDALSTAAAQMHWSLYVGVLSFWCRDRSPKQEDTLAMIDQSIQMFVDWLRRGGC